MGTLLSPSPRDRAQSGAWGTTEESRGDGVTRGHLRRSSALGRVGQVKRAQRVTFGPVDPAFASGPESLHYVPQLLLPRPPNKRSPPCSGLRVTTASPLLKGNAIGAALEVGLPLPARAFGATAPGWRSCERGAGASPPLDPQCHCVSHPKQDGRLELAPSPSGPDQSGEQSPRQTHPGGLIQQARARGSGPQIPSHFLGLERPLLCGAGGGGAGGPPTPCSPQPRVLGFRGRQEPRTQDPGGT